MGGKMTLFRIDVSRETGEVMVLMEAPCGWPHLEGMKEFTEMLLNFYNSRNEERDKVERVSNSLLSQALGDEQ